MGTQTVAIPDVQADALAVQSGVDHSLTAQFEAESLTLCAAAKAVVVADQMSYDQAVQLGNNIAGAQKRWKEWIARPYEVVYGAYKTILGTKKAIEDPLEEGKKHLARQLQDFTYRQEQIRREQERKLAEEQRRQEEERRLQAAAEAEAAGMQEEAVQQILEERSVAPAPVAATFTKNAGASTRENWAGEVTDFHALVKAAAKNKNLLPLLQINQPALNSQARVHKSMLADVIPGTRAVDKGAVAFRGAR